AAASNSPPTQSLPIVIPAPTVSLSSGIASSGSTSPAAVTGIGPHPFMLPPRGDEIAITLGPVQGGATGANNGFQNVGSGQISINLGLASATAGANAMSPSSSSAGFAADALIDPATVQSDSS